MQRLSVGRRIEDIESKGNFLYKNLYGIRDVAKELQKKKPKLSLYEAVNIVWENYVAKPTLGVHIENLKKIKSIKIPGTLILMPPFDYSSPLVQMWINERLVQFREKGLKLTYQGFIRMIAEKIECYKGKPLHIRDEEHLSIFNGKITAEAPDLWDLEEFDWNDPKNQEWIKREEERSRRYRKRHFQGWSEKDIRDFVDFKLKFNKKNPRFPQKKVHQITLKIFKEKIKKRKDH